MRAILIVSFLARRARDAATARAPLATSSGSVRRTLTRCRLPSSFRALTQDWLVEVHLKFKLMPETLYLTVNIIGELRAGAHVRARNLPQPHADDGAAPLPLPRSFPPLLTTAALQTPRLSPPAPFADRFLEKKLVVRQKLQLVGVTAMLLASKYEEIYAPEVRDFVYITDKAYTKEQILAMEAQMLNNLDFHITVPTAYVFLNRFLKVCGETDAAASKVNLLSCYFVERALQEYKSLAFLPSKLAAAGVNMALRTVRGAGAWDSRCEKYCGYKQGELVDCIREIQGMLEGQAANNLKAVSRKYALPKFSEVATIPIAML
jgi:hypothetical protein